MKAQIDRLLDNTDKLFEQQAQMNVTLARLTVSVEEHVRRSNMLEADISSVKKELTPLKEHVLFMKTSASNAWLSIKLLSLVGAVSGGAAKLLSLI